MRAILADESPPGNGRNTSRRGRVPDEKWPKATPAATGNGLDADLRMSGYIALGEAIGRMPTRPAWTEYFMPRDMRAEAQRRTSDHRGQMLFGSES